MIFYLMESFDHFDEHLWYRFYVQDNSKYSRTEFRLLLIIFHKIFQLFISSVEETRGERCEKYTVNYFTILLG